MRFRVIDKKTGKVADPEQIALDEEWANRLVYCDMEGFAIEEDGTLVLLDECGNCAYCPSGRFEIELLPDDDRSGSFQTTFRKVDSDDEVVL